PPPGTAGLYSRPVSGRCRPRYLVQNPTPVTSTIGRSAPRHRIVAHVLHPLRVVGFARCCNMWSYLGHLAAFVCELTLVAARGIEGIGLVAITALLSSAYCVSVWLVRDWNPPAQTYAPWETRSQNASTAPTGPDNVPTK